MNTKLLIRNLSKNKNKLVYLKRVIHMHCVDIGDIGKVDIGDIGKVIWRLAIHESFHKGKKRIVILCLI